LVSSVAPQQVTLTPQGTFNGVYSNGSAAQAISDLKLTGTLQVQFLTLLPNGAALPGPDGRDYVPFVATGVLNGNSPALGAVDASFNLPGLGAPAGFVVESANGKSGMLDVAPLGVAGSGRVFFPADPMVDLPGGVTGNTDFPFVLTGAIDNLMPPSSGPYATPVDGEAPLKSGTTIIRGGGGGGCAVARFDYIQGAGAQRAAAVAALWLPLMILIVLRRRARRAPVR
jgi:hypothetical protein